MTVVRPFFPCASRFIAGVALCLAPCCSLNAQRAGETGPAKPVAFSLMDQFGKRWSSDSLAGRWLVLVAGDRSHRQPMSEWSDSLHRAFGTDSARVRALLVADLRSVPRVMRRMAAQRAPRETHRRLLLDGDGTIARQLGLSDKVFTVIVIDPDQRVRLRLSNPPASQSHFDTVRELIGGR